ncbi:MAG: hypothetical protein IT347_05795 [Candidatus Eisenbacteria bacterium]|nr:hypothetical protein [Candidatus Eisenbacteria bacterium]
MKRQSWFRTALALVGVAGFGLLAAGCTNARVVGVWSDPNRPAGPAGSFLVVSQRKDAVQRRQWEDDVQAQLARSGLRAVSSYTLFPDGVPSQQALDDAMTSQHFDAAIVLKPLKATRDTRWVPGWRSVEPVNYYNPWTGYDRIVYRGRWHPGYAETDHTLREQVTVWDAAAGGRMVWAATVESTNPSSASDLRQSIGRGIVPGLRKAGVIA